MRAFLLMLALLAPAGAREPAPPAEDPLALAALLIQDGNAERAEVVLSGIDPDAENLDAPRYWTLLGLLRLKQDLPAEAARAFQSAIDTGGEDAVDPVLHLQLARAWILAGQPESALAALDRAGPRVTTLPGAFLVRARAERDRGAPDRAFVALDEGAQRFPTEPDFPRQQVLLLVEMGLTLEAGERAGRLLERPDASVEDALVVAEALRQSGALSEAARLLEEARLRHPNDRALLIRSAAVALDQGMPLAAARFLQVGAEIDPALALEAAELFRRARRLEEALYMNGRVLDPTEKLRQRFGILLDTGDFERAVALEERLHRLGLSREDGVAYGLAYALFRTGELDRAEALLGGIADPDLFRQATGLRDAIARCRETPGACP